MNLRLVRIQGLLLALATAAVIFGHYSALVRPLGIVLGAGAAWLDFVAIRGLVVVMLARRPTRRQVVPIAFVKSVVLIAIPALALFLPADLVDGPSFALGVTALPAAIVIDALLPFGASSERTQA